MTNHGPRITVSKEGPKFFSGVVRVLVIGLGGVIAVGVIGSLIGAEIFHAGAYKDLIVKEEGNFTDDVAELTMDQIPVVDRDSATKLGSRKLGEMSDLVSQFEICLLYTSIKQEVPYSFGNTALGSGMDFISYSPILSAIFDV